MTIHKLRILPIFLLITGLTLTSGCKKKDMSLRLNEPRNIRGVVSYKRSFPDLNDKHLEVAKAVGIRPLEDREEAESMKEKLTHITDNEFYVVDSLTHSIPSPTSSLVQVRYSTLSVLIFSIHLLPKD